ncbi:helix-turn-helix domain-containing protein [Priestia megaterium]|uniref:helix-turn-helix domain-containing protein n=1 Tax=Priestia megaterium TaxID=1404 RepID=UPI00336B5CB4
MKKATNSYKREHGLTIEQLNAIDLLIVGKTDKEVADITGVNRVTVTKWRNYDIYFQAELNQRRKAVWNVSIDKMRALVPKAIEKLEKEIEGLNGWKVSMEIIKIAGINGEYIMDTGKDSSDKILNDLAQKRATEEMYGSINDDTKQQILLDFQKQLNES